ncbi:B12-binding domain-containing radical SAM protein [Brevibacillus sp. NRS-1366]|uniref:B12-binding domain-containing radical SAM protein n=1 Tax=Brevibacillus sp. NRS-1366 TaxID=3233899 RepID=UPI003D229CD6
MSTLLIYPPICDPTSGYHSLCYLETYARTCGFNDIDIVDTNIEAFLYTIRPEQFQSVRKHIENRYETLKGKHLLNGYEQLELQYAWRLRSLDFDNLPQAIDTLRSHEVFYDYSRYRLAVQLITSWMDALSLLAYPGQFNGFNLSVSAFFNLQSSVDISSHEICEKITAPFEPYFRNVLLPRILESGYKTVGINVTYNFQLPFALTIGRMIRNTFPNIVVLYGGTEVSDVWKYLQDKSKFFSIFDSADACVIGEGEVAFTKLLGMIYEGKGFSVIPNVHFHPRHSVTTELPSINYFNLAEMPTPDYSKLNWSLYLSPEPFVYYSPSRGCYWNKCTFCDYGLNGDSPTSPWRHNSIDKIIEDLEIFSKKYKFVYFSVDVLSPSMLLQLAEVIIKKKIDIRWGAEIRLEKYWSNERCELLKNSGCVAISVGFESGNQRILNLINKGTQVERVEETIKNFHSANIGVQIMGFTGFPTETLEEAMESVNFLNKLRAHWTFGGLGTFALTPGAIVAKKEQEFNITDVTPYDQEDIVRNLYYKEKGGSRTNDERDFLKKQKGKLMLTQFDRPWVGGVDSSHSFFYHDRFGTAILRELNLQANPITYDQLYILNGYVVEDIKTYPIEKLLKMSDVTSWMVNSKREHKKGFLLKDTMSMLEQHVIESAPTASPKRFLIRTDGKIISHVDQFIQFLYFFTNEKSFSDYLKEHPNAEEELYYRLLRISVAKDYIRSVGSLNVIERLASEQPLMT